MNTRTMLAILAGTTGFVRAGDAQTVRTLVDNARDSLVRMAFAGRPDACNRDHQGDWRDSDRYWESTRSCGDGLIRVLLEKEGGAVVRIHAYVGGRWRAGPASVTDLHIVSAPSATEYLLYLVRHDPVGPRAIMPATLADSVDVWPPLLALAKDETLSRRINKEAMQWLGITAGRFFEDDESRDADSEVRRRAVFSVSQLPADEGIPRLIEISTTHRYEYVRRLAIFWLGQSGDKRALPVFEDLLRSRG